MKFVDRASIGKIKRTSEGYIATQARAIRTGVQEYVAWEFGDTAIADGFDKDAIIRVNRPPESVFDKESLKSATHIPVTVDHPDELVNSENYADLAVGETSTDVLRDGEMVAFSIMVKDKRGLDAIDSGKVELSAGYTADMTRVDHKDYDYVMGPPKYNHIAIVDRARAGSQARIGDNAKPWGAAPATKPEKEVKMTDMKTVVVGDKDVQVTAADADVITKLIKDHAAALEAKDAKIAELKIEVADTAKQVKTDEDIAAIIKDGIAELAIVTDKARKLVKDYDASDKDAMTIRRDVIASVYGDEAIADLTSDAEIKAAFKVARVADQADPVKDALGKKEKNMDKDKVGSKWEGMFKAKKEDK